MKKRDLLSQTGLHRGDKLKELRESKANPPAERGAVHERLLFGAIIGLIIAPFIVLRYSM